MKTDAPEPRLAALLEAADASLRSDGAAPAGGLNRLRRQSYRSSQEARPD